MEFGIEKCVVILTMKREKIQSIGGIELTNQKRRTLRAKENSE